MLVAIGLLWWAWWSARALRRGGREGWTLLLVLGGVSVVQAILTSRAVLACTDRSRQHADAATGPPREVVGRPPGRHRAGAGLRRRRRARPPQLGGGRRADATDSTPNDADGVSDPG